MIWRGRHKNVASFLVQLKMISANEVDVQLETERSQYETKLIDGIDL